MYTVSNEFKENVQSNAVVATARITLVADGTVLDGNNLASVSIKDYCNNNGSIIGTTMCKEAEIEIINNGYNLADKEFLLEVGVEVAEDTIEYIPYGNFVVKEYTDMKSNNRYKIVAYDYMDKLNKEFTDNNTYPMTLQAFYEAFATQYGVQIETQTLPNQEFVVQEKPYFEGATGRTVLSAIAQMFGSFAKFNRNNKLQMYLKNETNEQISREQMNSKLEIDDRYGPLNTVVLRLGEAEGENVTLKSDELINSARGKNLINIPSEYKLYQYEFRIPLFLKAGEYILSTEDIDYQLGNYPLIVFYYEDNTTQSVGVPAGYSGNISFTKNVTEYSIYAGKSYIDSEGLTTTFKKLMLRASNTTSEYEPFEPVGEVTLEIIDNPFVYTEELRYRAIQGIYDRVLGFTYIPTSFNYKSYLYLDCGDAVQVQQMKTDDYVNTIILNQEIKVPATRKSKCENLALTRTQVTNQFVSPEKQAQRRTELLVDKQGQKIEGLITKTDAQGTQLTTISANLSGVTTRVESTEERITTVEEDIDNTNQAVSDLGQRVTDEVSNLQGQIDGAIQLWNGPEIPTLNNEPATNWQTEEERNAHRADIYTVIEDVDGEMKQGKSYRFDKIGTEWTWVELTDNELSAVQALAASKAKVFVTTPKPPYNIGDLWLRNEELYECIVKKDANGAFLESDWQKATKYTDDTLAQLAQATADKAIYEQTITNKTSEGKFFYLTDSADINCKSVEIFGESTQKTRSGQNLLRNSGYDRTSNGITFTINGDKSITLNGTNDGNGNSALYLVDNVHGSNDILTLEIGKTYTVSNTGDKNIQIVFYTANEGYYIDKNGLTFTASATDYAYRLVYLQIPKGNTTTFNNYTVYPQLVEGETNLPYEEYGASPSPDYPSEIKSVSGKNLFDPNNVLVNLYLGANLIGPATGEYVFYAKCEPSTAYSIQRTKANTSALHIACSDRIPANYVAVTNFIDYGANDKAENYVTSTNAQYLCVRINPDAGTATLDEVINSFQIEKNAQATFYVPYNHIGFKSVGKNLLSNLIKAGSTQNGVTFTYNDDGTYTANGTATNGNSTCYLHNLATKPFTLKAGTYYTIPIKSVGAEIMFYDGTSWRALIHSTSTSFTLDQDTTFSLVYCQVTNTTTVSNVIIYPMISETPITEADYEPYKESITTIPLLHDMRSLPSGARDRICYRNGKWYDEQIVEQVILNGSEYWVTYSVTDGEGISYGYGTPLAKTPKQDLVNNNFALSNYFKQIARGFLSTKSDVGMYIGSQNYVYLKIPKAIIDAITFETWISEHNPEIIYELAEPIVTEITDEDMINALESIRTFKGITNIEAAASSILTYYRNVPIVEEYETKSSAQKQYKVTEEKFAQHEITNEQIISSVGKLTTTITDNYATKQELESEIKQTSEAITISINSSIEDLKNKGVPKVVSKIVTIDDNGLTVGASDSQFTNTMNNTGNYQYNAGVLIAKYDKDGAEIPRLKSDYAVIADVKYIKEDISGVIHHRTYILELE